MTHLLQPSRRKILSWGGAVVVAAALPLAAAQTANAAKPKLTINGSWNNATRVAWQKHLKSNNWYSGAIDGVFGPLTWKGVQRQMAAPGFYSGYIDGDFGAMSLKSLHNYLYTYWGSGQWLMWANQAQMYFSPAARLPGNENDQHIQDVVRAVQSGLNRYGQGS